MLLKRENKKLFESAEKPKRPSCSASKRSLIKIPSTSKLPQDFFKPNEVALKSLKTLNKKESKNTFTNSLLFTFKPSEFDHFSESAPEVDSLSQK